MLGADGAGADRPPARARRPPASASRSSCCEARDPRRLLERRRRARARVQIVHVPRSEYASRTAASARKQVAEVTLPRAELDRIWSAEYLERLARTYWRFLTRVSLGLLRVLYTDDAAARWCC